MDSPSDPLLQRLCRGDRDALGEFIHRERFRLIAYIQRRLGNRLRGKIEADDLLQEVAAECVRSLPHTDLRSRDPFRWLCQVAERRIVDAHRRFFQAQKRSAGREIPLQAGEQSHADLIHLLVASITSPSQAFSRDQRHMRLLDALNQLPEESREALRLRYVEELPTREIAQRLGKSDGAVRVLLTRSLKRLEKLLAP